MDACNRDVASSNWTHWHGISWQDAHQMVGRLQARIAKAAKANDWRTVRRLQRLITRSTSAKARGPVIYRPGTERQSHYFHAHLARPFDVMLHLDETRALAPLEPYSEKTEEPPETFPTGM